MVVQTMAMLRRKPVGQSFAGNPLVPAKALADERFN